MQSAGSEQLPSSSHGPGLPSRCDSQTFVTIVGAGAYAVARAGHVGIVASGGGALLIERGITCVTKGC